MRNTLLAVALAAASAGVASPLHTQAQTNATLTTIPFESQLLHAKAPINVILPVSYDDGVTRYPVLLLLHGLEGHYHDWVNSVNIVRYASKYPVIIVMPEGGNGWYTNGVAPNAKWEDYIIKEVIPYVDGHYRTPRDHQLWAVAGLSMGGYGALKFGLKYREQFSFAASMSGALAAPDWKDADLPNWELLRNSIHEAFGPEGSPAHKANSLATLLDASTEPLPFIYLDCGTEDGFLVASRKFSELLQSKKIPHEYRERPGLHDWAEWDHQIQQALQLLAEFWHLSRCALCEHPTAAACCPPPK